MARYQLSSIGVLDTADGVHLLPGCDGWAAYQAWIAAGNVPDPVPVVPVPRDVTLAGLWGRIKELRQRCKDGGVAVSIAGTERWFHTDADSRIQWLDLLTDVRDGTLQAGLLWKSMSGDFVALTDEVVLAYRAALKVKETAAFTRAEVLRAAINNAADPLLVDLTTGWPANFNDPLPIPETP